MFTKILVANRGEIACRVIATARRLGIATVAVYSDADGDAQHVAMADEAVRIGPSAAVDSYLKAERIIDAARQTGAEAIHPGYGFLSEQPDFVDRVESAGIHFIGPPADAIRAMGLKDAAKRLMEQAGVPVVPGYHGASQETAKLAAEAEKIGYPVLIKARAGGGGKGMRLVERPDDFSEALASAQREAESSFGDRACLIEKYIRQPRHIEIQVFGDNDGNCVYLFERDCSLQRRHQKVIEEAPAPGMPGELREAMGKSAVEAARAIGYVGAGTVEFIVDGSGELSRDRFWFMEMNTRLQVEHPVTEAITGLDLVEWQLRIAAGESLPFGQAELALTGHSFEARVYAEDVTRGFLPATGRLDYLSFPDAECFQQGSVRIDSGVRQGDEISPWYDPMIAKIITHAPDRAAALNLLGTALDRCHIAGTITNVPFLRRLVRNPEFARGQVDTGLIGRNLESLAGESPPPPLAVALAALGGLGLLAERTDSDPWDGLAGWRHWTEARQYITLEYGGVRHAVETCAHGRGRYSVVADGGELTLAVDASGGNRYLVCLDGIRRQVDVVTSLGRVSVFAEGRSDTFQLPDALAQTDTDQGGGDAIFAPMPGVVTLVNAQPGQRVCRGEALLVLEAMKMEHTLVAPRDGVVAEILVDLGEQVSEGAMLVAMEAAGD